MQRKTRRMIAAVVVIALLAAGGAAFTASIGGVLDGQNANIGFGSEKVTGAQATAVNYALDSNGEYIQHVAVTLQGTNYDSSYTYTGSLTEGNDVKGSGTVVATGTCTPQTPSGGTTVVDCDFTTATGGTSGVYVDSVDGFQLSVTGSNSGGTTQTLGGGSKIS
jgi:hypothetical protein